jgi:hypothetical protein
MPFYVPNSSSPTSESDQKDRADDKAALSNTLLTTFTIVLGASMTVVACYAGVLACRWGPKQVLAEKQSPATEAPKYRVERLGLGADGTGGVWLRELRPWEK